MPHPIILALSSVIALSTACGDDAADNDASTEPDVTQATDTSQAGDAQTELGDDATATDDVTADIADDGVHEVADVTAPDLVDAHEDSLADADDDAEVGPSADETLCWATSGAWVEGACDCQQDGMTTNLDYQFVPELGCVPNASLLCGATGGVWEEDACQCPQDGASAFFEFFLTDGGCKLPPDDELAAALEAGALFDIIALTFPDQLAVRVVDRPGAFDVVTLYDDVGALLTALSGTGWDTISAAAGGCEGPVLREARPTVDCGSDEGGASKDGCFLQSVNDEYHRASTLMQLAVDYAFGAWTEGEIEAMRALEGRILLVFVDTDHGATLAFAREDGRWVLVVIDLAYYSCSA